MNKKNKELIKTLYAERKRLYPNGCPFAPRGCGKTFLYLMHFLRLEEFIRIKSEKVIEDILEKHIKEILAKKIAHVL